MLRTRIITAALLFSAFFLSLFYLSPLGWLALATLVAVIAFWEWGGLIQASLTGRVLLGLSALVICSGVALAFPSALGLDQGFAGVAWHVGRWFYVPAAAVWLCVVPWWLRKRWPVPNFAIGYATGLVVILPAWLALVQLRQSGALVLLMTMAVVWLADIAAYFSGRAFGRHKLAPAISPGKTWEGALGAVLAVVVGGFLFSSGLPAMLKDNHVLLLGVLVFLTVFSVVGDLFESMLKRQVGIKDSSSILPGHGGVLDRIDSLTSTVPLAALVWFSAFL